MACILRSLKHMKYFGSLSGKFLNYRVPEHCNLNVCASQHIFLSQRFIRTNLAVEPMKDENEIDKILNKMDLQIQRFGNIRSFDIQQVIQLLETKGVIESIQALILIRACGSFLLELSPQERSKIVEDVWNNLHAYNTPLDVSHYNALLVVYHENEHDFSPLEFLSQMEKQNIIPNKVTYERLLKNCCRQGDINGITQIVDSMKKEDIPLSESTFNSFILGYSQAGDFDSAMNVLDLMKQSNVEPTAETYTALMCACAKVANFEKIQQILSECRTKELLLSNRHILEVILALCINKHNDYANEMIPLLVIPKIYPIEEMSSISKMIENNQENMAMKLFEHLSLFDRSSCNNLVLGKLMSRVESENNIVEICRNMEKSKLFPNVTLTALETCLRKDNQSLIWSIMDLCREQNHEIRVHYFWPILISKARSYNYQGMLDVLNRMITNYKVKPNAETLAKYVLPYTTNGLASDMEKLLVDCQVPFTTIHHAMMIYLLNDGKLRQAHKYMKRNIIDYKEHLIADALNIGFSKTRDIESVVEILLSLGKNNQRNFVVGSFPFSDLRVLPDMLSYMQDRGYYMTPTLVNDLITILGEKCDPDLRKTLEDLALTDNNMNPRTDQIKFTQLDEKDIIQKINVRANQGFNTDRLKFELLTYYIKDYNLEKVNETLEALNRENLQLFEGNYANLIELFCQTEFFHLAEHYYKEMREKYPDSELDYRKRIIYATALIKNGKVTEAKEMLSVRASPTHVVNKRQKFMADQRICSDLLNTLVQKDDEKNLEEFFKILVENNYLQISNSAISPFIRIYLQRQDLKAALEKFLWAYDTYNLLPYKRELSLEFIRLEDSESLQTIIDCSMKIIGEGRTLINLVICLLECDRLHQAKKVLQTSQFTLPMDSWDEMLLRFHNVKVLEHLIEIGSNIPSINRLVLYKRMMVLYDINDEWQKGLNLWMKMQENDILPDEEFLSILHNMLVNNNQNVPFVFNEMKSMVQNSKSLPDKLQNILQLRKFNYAFRVLQNTKTYTENLDPVYEELINYNLKGKNIGMAIQIVNHGLSLNPKLSEKASFKKVMELMERKKDNSSTEKITVQQ